LLVCSCQWWEKRSKAPRWQPSTLSMLSEHVSRVLPYLSNATQLIAHMT